MRCGGRFRTSAVSPVILSCTTGLMASGDAGSFGEVFFQLHEGEEADRPGELRPAVSMSLAGVCSPREAGPKTPILATWTLSRECIGAYLPGGG